MANIKDQSLSESILDCISYSLAGDWKRFGRLMQLEESQIDCIDLENNWVYEKCRKCLAKCIQMQPNLRWLDVQKVLKDIERNDVIMKCETQATQIPFKVGNPKFDEARKKLQTQYIRQYAELFDTSHNNVSPRGIDRISAFVELAISPSRDVREYWKHNSERDYHLNQHLFKGKTITVENIMTENSPLVCLGGVAGSGKSTLLLYTVLKWARGELWNVTDGQQYDFVFTIICREINCMEKLDSLESLLKFLYPDVFHLLTFEELQSIADRVLIIIDGIDEFIGLTDMLSQHHGKMTGISKCLYQAINPVNASLFDHKVLISGRPEAIGMVQQKFRKLVSLKSIEVLGFDQKNIELFVHNIFYDNKEKEVLVLQKLKESTNLSLMASLPVYLSIICSLFSSETSMNADTSVELYSWALGLYLKNHFRTEDMSYMTLRDIFKRKDVGKVLTVVSEMAYQMLCNGTVVFNADSLPQICEESLEYCGLVTKVFIDEFTIKYQFRHLSLQEFCAAIHILKEGFPRKEILENHRLRGCIPVLCGLESALIPGCHTANITKAILNALDVKNGLAEKPCIQLLAENLFVEARHCVLTGSNEDWNLFAAACFEYHNLLDKDLLFTIAHSEITLYIKNFSNIQINFMVYFLNQLTSLSPFPVKEIYLQIGRSDIFGDAYKVLAKCMCLASRVHIEKVDVVMAEDLSVINSEFSRSIENGVTPGIKDLRFYDCKLTSDHLLSLGAVLRNLNSLVLSYNKTISLDGWRLIAEIFENEQSCLKKLHVRDCSISDSSFEILAPIVPKLKEFEVCDNPGISLKSWSCLAKYALSENLLERFRARCCYLTDSIIEKLIPLLWKVEELDVSFNQAITSVGWKHLSDFVQQRYEASNPLKRLFIKNCCIDDIYLKKISLFVGFLEGSPSRPHMIADPDEKEKSELLIINCDLNDKSIKLHCQNMLQYERIDLSFNRNIGTAGWRYFVESMQDKESKLKQLAVCDCELNDEHVSILSTLFPRLKELRLSGNNNITETGWSIVSCADDLHQLPFQELNFRSCNLSDASVNMLKQVFCHLRYVSFKNNPNITENGWKVFAESVLHTNVVSLKYLNISDCNIDDSKLKILLPIIPCLHTLKLGGNMKVSTIGWKNLGDFGNNDKCKLTQLYIFRCLLTDEDFFVLVPLIATVETIDLRYNKGITDIGWQVLANYLCNHPKQNLQQIDMYGCLIANTEVELLKDMVNSVIA